MGIGYGVDYTFRHLFIFFLIFSNCFEVIIVCLVCHRICFFRPSCSLSDMGSRYILSTI